MYRQTRTLIMWRMRVLANQMLQRRNRLSTRREKLLPKWPAFSYIYVHSLLLYWRSNTIHFDNTNQKSLGNCAVNVCAVQFKAFQKNQWRLTSCAQSLFPTGQALLFFALNILHYKLAGINVLRKKCANVLRAETTWSWINECRRQYVELEMQRTKNSQLTHKDQPADCLILSMYVKSLFLIIPRRCLQERLPTLHMWL